MTGWEELVAGAEGGGVSRGSMFGSQGLRTGKKFFAIWWHEQLVLKLPPTRQESLVAAGQAVPFEPMGYDDAVRQALAAACPGVTFSAGMALVTGDRPVQVGSHYHFAEANAALDFDRTAAWGHRLAVPAGTSVRFEPGMPRDVELVALAGNRIVPGLRGLAGGPLDGPPPEPAEVDDTPAAEPENGSPR